MLYVTCVVAFMFSACAVAQVTRPRILNLPHELTAAGSGTADTVVPTSAPSFAPTLSPTSSPGATEEVYCFTLTNLEENGSDYYMPMYQIAGASGKFYDTDGSELTPPSQVAQRATSVFALFYQVEGEAQSFCGEADTEYYFAFWTSSTLKYPYYMTSEATTDLVGTFCDADYNYDGATVYVGSNFFWSTLTGVAVDNCYDLGSDYDYSSSYRGLTVERAMSLGGNIDMDKQCGLSVICYRK